MDETATLALMNRIMDHNGPPTLPKKFTDESDSDALEAREFTESKCILLWTEITQLLLRIFWNYHSPSIT
jgi:hypothetical protein